MSLDDVQVNRFSAVGKSIPRVDAIAKALGKAPFAQDLHGQFPGLLHGKVLRSPHAHARIVSIDTFKAERLPGVRAVVTGRDEDIPLVISHFGIDNFSFPAKDEVIWAGQGVAAVAAESVEIAEEALDLIRVEYEVLPHLIDVEEAMKENPVSVIDPSGTKYAPETPNIVGSYKLLTGDVEKGFAEADVIVENRYYASRICHSQLECPSCIVRAESSGGITMWTNACGVHIIKAQVCTAFQLPESKVRIIQTYQGGSFGNRLTPCIEHLATFLALRTGGTVEVTLTRKEMFTSSPSNWPVTTYIKTGAKKDGAVVAQKIKLIKDTGAILSCWLTGIISGSGAVCVYGIPNFFMETYGVTTNMVPVGPYRGFGSPQVEFAVELQMDMLAEKLGMSPLEIRRKNVLQKGDQNAYGEVITSIGVMKCLNAAAEAIKLDEPSIQEPGPWRKGKGIAMAGKQNTVHGRSEAEVLVHSDGSVEVLYGADENGMGAETVLAQIAAEELGIPVDRVKVTRGDTAVTPYDNFSSSSRTTFNTGNAVVLACRDAIRQICEAAAREFGEDPGKVEVKNGKAIIKGANVEEVSIADFFKPFIAFIDQKPWELKKGTPVRGRGVFSTAAVIPWDQNGRTPRLWNWYQYNACAVEVAVNVETGQVKVLSAASASDMGFPINPKMCEGQIEGGVCMGLGFSINEEYLYNENGAITNCSLLDYRLPTILDMPSGKEFKSVLAPDPLPDGPYGAKGIAESVTVPVGPAIAAAINNAVGVRPKVMPMSAERILQLIKERGKGDQND